MAELANHPGHELRDDAAAQFNLLESDHGIISVNSAKRELWEQDELIHRYYVIGGPANRPPYLYAPKVPANESRHVVFGGIAVDTTHVSHMLKYGEAYGFYQPYAFDPPHFEFDPARVRIRATSKTTTKEEEEEDMPIAILQRNNSNLKKSLYDVKTGRAIRGISKDENLAFRGARSGAVVYITVSDAEYNQRGGAN